MKHVLFLIGILFSSLIFAQNENSISTSNLNNLLKDNRFNKNATHKLDSIIISEHYNSDDIWETKTIQKYTYNSEGKIATCKQFDYNLDEGTSGNTSKNEYTYDSNGNLTINLEYYWEEETSEWKQGTKEEFTYDMNNNIISNISSSFVNATSTWKYTDKREYEYNEESQEITNSYFQWSTSENEWKSSNKVETIYNGSGLKSESTSYNWLDDSWHESSKYIFTYQDITLSSYLIQIWSTGLSTWVDNTNSTLTYDENENNTLRIIEKWDTENSLWENFSKYEYEYDTNGDLIFQTSSSWDDATSTWKESDKSNFSYNQAIPTSNALLDLELINEFFNFHYYKDINSPSGYIYSNYYSDAWHEAKKGECFYSELSSNISNNSGILNDLSIYPNPSNGIINISISNIEKNHEIAIYDISGNIIKVDNLSDNIQLDLSEYSNGQYFIRYNNGVKIGIVPFIISK